MDHDAPPSPSPRPLPSRARWLGTFSALLVLLALGGLVWHLSHRPSADVPMKGGPPGRGLGGGGPATTVGVAAVQAADIPIYLDALGTVTPQASVTVRPQVSGRMQKVLFQEGQQVKAGDVLAIIDRQPFELALMQARGQRQRDEAQLAAARVTLQRFETLLTQDSIARQDVDTQASLVKQLEGTVATDKAAEGTARLNLAYTRVTAPISGRVGLRVVDVGNIVSEGDTAGIAVITQLAPIDVVFSVPQDQVAQVRAVKSAPVDALDRARKMVLERGAFSTLDNRIDTQTGTVKAKARFINARNSLFPNQFVNVRLLLNTLSGAIVVPVAALRHGSDGDYVYVLNRQERTVAMRLVKRGQASVDTVAIISGLQAGEEVITEGADRLKDGARVALPGDKPTLPGGGRGRRGNGAASAPAASDSASVGKAGEPVSRPSAAAASR